MKTLIINGSPNGRKGNTEVFCQKFASGMQAAPEVRHIVEEDAADLAAYMENFDHWLFFFPMYVNAMPGIVKRLFEQMQPDPQKGIGYFVQYGFEETAQSDYLRAILKNFTARMGYQDLGIVVAGGMAGVRYMPESMNKKLFGRLQMAGMLYEQAGAFREEGVRLFGRVHQYSKAQLGRIHFFKKLGLSSDIFWNRMLKSNNAFHKRFDKPFGA